MKAVLLMSQQLLYSVELLVIWMGFIQEVFHLFGNVLFLRDESIICFVGIISIELHCLINCIGMGSSSQYQFENECVIDNGANEF